MNAASRFVREVARNLRPPRGSAARFVREVAYELRRCIPRTIYFLRTGELHPEVRPPWWP